MHERNEQRGLVDTDVCIADGGLSSLFDMNGVVVLFHLFLPSWSQKSFDLTIPRCLSTIDGRTNEALMGTDIGE